MGSGDAPVVAGDRDGDLVPDDVDNCPDDKNFDQANEDGDRFGDLCDRCPNIHDASAVTVDEQADADHDLVGDACDPHPAVAGDSIVMFEGFHHGVPADWLSSDSTKWTAVDDAVQVIVNKDAKEFLAPAMSVTDHVTVSAAIVLDVVPSDGGAYWVDLGVPFAPAGIRGIDCELNQDGGQRTVRQYDDFVAGGSFVEIGRADFQWTNHTRYRVTANRYGVSYDCNVIDGSGNTVTLSSLSSSPVSGAATVGIFASGVTAHLEWVLVVRSP